MPFADSHDILWRNDVPLFKKYHVGCGSILAQGFLNIDGAPLENRFDYKEHYVYKVKELADTFILKYDLSNGIPAQHNSLCRIYHSHFLEHLTREQGLTFLKDCFTSLKSGGIMRFALPDFHLWCSKYINEDQIFFDWYRMNFLPEDEYHFQTRSQIFTGMLYNHGHQMAYDFKSISLLLNKIGFRDVVVKEWGVSEQFEGLELLEASDSMRKDESLVIECVK